MKRPARAGRLAACLTACVAGTSPSVAAAAEDDSSADAFAKNHRRTQLAGMGVLTGWAVINIGSGIAGALVIENDRRFVHEMNAMWNTVNLTLGIVGLATGARRKPAADPHRLYRKTRLTYMVNGALDVLYVGAGVLTAELGRLHDSPRAQGYGHSVVLQGAFLLAFDLGMLIAHERVAARLPHLRIAPRVGPDGFGLVAGASF